eukprot:3996021-Prymnesium_polylepis.1
MRPRRRRRGTLQCARDGCKRVLCVVLLRPFNGVGVARTLYTTHVLGRRGRACSANYCINVSAPCRGAIDNKILIHHKW